MRRNNFWVDSIAAWVSDNKILKGRGSFDNRPCDNEFCEAGKRLRKEEDAVNAQWWIDGFFQYPATWILGCCAWCKRSTSKITANFHMWSSSHYERWLRSQNSPCMTWESSDTIRLFHDANEFAFGSDFAVWKNKAVGERTGYILVIAGPIYWSSYFSSCSFHIDYLAGARISLPSLLSVWKSP